MTDPWPFCANDGTCSCAKFHADPTGCERREERRTDLSRGTNPMTHPSAQPVIAKADLIDGAYYEGRCRNATVARWNATREVFIHWRTKFGDTFLEAIRHPEDEAHYDVFLPWRQLDEADVDKPIPFDGGHVRGLR